MLVVLPGERQGLGGAGGRESVLDARCRGVEDPDPGGPAAGVRAPEVRSTSEKVSPCWPPSPDCAAIISPVGLTVTCLSPRLTGTERMGCSDWPSRVIAALSVTTITRFWEIGAAPSTP